MRLLICAAAGVGLLVVSAVPARAQSGTMNIAANSPSVNASGGSVADRRPGTWISAARARHNNLVALRLRGPRFGQQNTTEAEARWGNQSSSSSAGGLLGGLQGLLDLANQFGVLGSGGTDLSNLGGLIGGLAGGTAGRTTGGSSTTTSGGTDTSGLADLIRSMAEQRAAGGKTGSSMPSAASGKSSTARTTDGATVGGAVARLPKPEQRFQQSNQTTTNGSSTSTREPSFKIRWADAMLQTFFSALAVGLQSSDFIEIFKDMLRPLIVPPADTNTNTNGNGNTDGNGGTNGDAGGPGTGDGINNIPSNGTDGGGSTI